MKKFLPLLLLLALPAASPCPAAESTDPSEHAQREEKTAARAADFPGRLLGAPTEEREAAFRLAWRYRARTYELHYEEARPLARTVYGLALHAGDIDAALPLERFLAGLLGYHYSLDQVCAWLNDVLERKFPSPALDEAVLVGMLLRDGILRIQDGRFQPTGAAGHILAAAPGKKRSFAAALRHERLHVFWDEDAAFREQCREDWKKLSESERGAALKQLARYAKDNEAQLIEEWAVARAEASEMCIR